LERGRGVERNQRREREEKGENREGKS